jgi:hypothetical protein
VLSAGGNAIVDLASANLTSVNAGAAADVQAGTLNVGTISAPEVLVRGGTINVGTIFSAGDIYVSSSGGSATVGTAQAGDDVYVMASGGNATLTNAILTGGAPDAVGLVINGSPDVANNGRVVSVSSLDGNAVLGQQTGSVSGATAVSVVAGQDAIVQVAAALPGVLTVSAQRDATLSAPAVNFNAVQAGRDVTLMTTAGDFTGANPLVAARNLSIGASGALTVGDITAISGSIALSGRTVSAGVLIAGQDLTLQATGGGVQAVSFTAGRDLTLQGSSFSLGQQIGTVARDLSITTPGDFTAPGDLTAGRNITLNVGGTANLKGLSGPGTVDIVANDLTLGAAVAAANVQIESASGTLRVGGSAADGTPASGLWLDNAEFGRIRATGQVSLYAGTVAGTARGDLTVLQLDVNPAATPQVNFLVGSGHNALIQGVMAPTASGGVIQVGDPTNTAWRPTSVLVSGTIGSANFSNDVYSNVRAFDHVRLFAGQDIIIGSQRFIGLIQKASIADIEIGKNRPAGVAPTGAEQNRVLVAAGDLELSAPGRAVSQNTATSADRSIGLFLTGKASPNLILDPPQLVDLYGSILGHDGAVVSSFAAAGVVSVAVLDGAGNPTTAPAGSVYRFNSCTVGANQCAAAADLTANLQQDTPDLEVSVDGGLLRDAAGGRNSGPPLLTNAPPDADAVLAEPVVTGAGSEEIWRKHAPTATKTPETKR